MPRPATRAYNDQYLLIEQLSTNVVELMRLNPDEQLREATFALIEAITPDNSPRISRKGHGLCLLFEKVAVALQCIIDAPTAVIDELVGNEISGSPVLAACAKIILKRAVQTALAVPMAPVALLHLKACMCAVAFCPDTSGHQSLDSNCLLPITRHAATLSES